MAAAPASVIKARAIDVTATSIVSENKSSKANALLVGTGLLSGSPNDMLQSVLLIVHLLVQ
jgi:hypothetical protein